MSLLLDALKKAADDKQKAAQEVSTTPGSISTDHAVIDASNENDNIVAKSESSPSSVEELSLQAIDDVHGTENLTIDAAEDPELSLDELALEVNDPTRENLQDNEPSQSESEVTLEPAVDKNIEDKDTPKHRFTVSDDALSMLIQNTNRDVNRSKKILYSSVIILSIVILVSGGVYLYQDMQEEIATLERKHQIAMQSMRSKTSKERAPEKTEIIRSLVSESDLDEKVQYAKQHMASQAKPKQSKQKPKAVSAKKDAGRDLSNAVFTIQKTNKNDPIGERLDAAWLAYENGQYAEAKDAYKNILAIEKNNRDALLGMGAIALHEENESMARKFYLSLLKLDPRDAIATAALASLRKGEASFDGDEQYLLEMLQKNPQAPQLNFAIANIYAQQNKWKAAQQYYFNAWQGDLENADYIFNLAVSMDQLNKPQQAINFYRDSLVKAENNQVGFSRAAVQKRIKELTEL